jgi:hypothetical protein
MQPGIAIFNVQVREIIFNILFFSLCVYKFLYSELTEMDNPPVDHFQKAMDYQSVLPATTTRLTVKKTHNVVFLEPITAKSISLDGLFAS